MSEAAFDVLTDEDEWLPSSLREVRAIEVWPKWQGQGFDLMAVDTSAPVRWVPGAERIIRRGERQSWVASQGEGKTQAMLHLAAQVCDAGGYVAYVDHENDAHEMAGRLQPIVADLSSPERVRERLLYLPALDLRALLADDGGIARFAELCSVLDLLVIDSLTRVLASFGLDEDSNADVARFMQAFPDALAQSGVAVLLADNTGHDGARARGAISKSALVEAVYGVSGGTKVKPDRHGTITLKLLRSRSGRIADFVSCGSGGGRHTPLEPQDGAETVAGSKMERRRSDLAALLASEPELAFRVEELAEHASVSTNTVVADMKALVADGAAEGSRSVGWQARRAVGQSMHPSKGGAN